MQIHIAEEAASNSRIPIRMRSVVVKTLTREGDFNYLENVFNERSQRINQGIFY